jgi:hypothetical protein
VVGVNEPLVADAVLSLTRLAALVLVKTGVLAQVIGDAEVGVACRADQRGQRPNRVTPGLVQAGYDELLRPRRSCSRTLRRASSHRGGSSLPRTVQNTNVVGRMCARIAAMLAACGFARLNASSASRLSHADTVQNVLASGLASSEYPISPSAEASCRRIAAVARRKPGMWRYRVSGNRDAITTYSPSLVTSLRCVHGSAGTAGS